ncbi:MAG: hypothetical protein KatS3mg060_3309 [Dehalococcoidia bacterium]|nr:MAG: hypothetical protein KatS3mg060_3309 [Dehalococcoidia bacterium]
MQRGKLVECTVLLVEDDASLRQTIRDVLELEGYRVLTAADGVDGLDLLDREEPNVILLDLMMPRMNGYQFAESLAGRKPAVAIPIILLTADARAPDKAQQVGASAWLHKPFEIDELVSTVERACDDALSGS